MLHILNKFGFLGDVCVCVCVGVISLIYVHIVCYTYFLCLSPSLHVFKHDIKKICSKCFQSKVFAASSF